MADFGVGDDWATLYSIKSQEPGKGHAAETLTAARAHYEAKGKTCGGSTALSSRMRKVYERLGITEYR